MIGSKLVLSLAEWEYAYRFRDHLAVGEPKPDAGGFDRERLREIERTISGVFYARRERLRKRPR